MASAEAAPEAGPSPLDKPLRDLTEEDIAQLTREDCRQYLKQKGMRRPSWNKSQAIQQVISLKTLLEGPLIDDTPLASPPTSASAAADLELPSEVSGETQARSRNVSPSLSSIDDRDTGQMTIFYCGKVNVYEDIYQYKAKAIMHLASSSNHSFNGSLNEAVPAAPHLNPFQTTSFNNFTSSSPISNTAGKGIQNMEGLKSMQENDYDGSTSRKASLQRYLDKRKERFDPAKRPTRS